MHSYDVITDAETGQFKVVQTVQVAFGTFPARDMAELFRDALVRQRVQATDLTSPPAPVAEMPRIVETAAKGESAEPQKGGEEDEAWGTALSRIEKGESCADVAESMGLPFKRLRGKWAYRVREKKGDEETAAPVPLADRRKISSGDALRPATHKDKDDDAPVSGGVGGVLSRGKISGLTDDQQDTLLAADPADLPALAQDWMRSAVFLREEKRRLEARAARLMQGD